MVSHPFFEETLVIFGGKSSDSEEAQNTTWLLSLGTGGSFLCVCVCIEMQVFIVEEEM